MDFLTPQSAAAPLALVGVGALFPGAAESDDFWRHIIRGSDLLSDVPENYWLTDDYYDADPSAPLKTYGRRGGFIPKVPFDSMANGIPPTNVPMTDASQLLALVVAKRVLEDACGIDLGRLDRARTSVILGVAGGSWLLTQMNAALQRPVWTKAMREAGLPETQVQAICSALEASYPAWTESTFPGLLGNVIAGRVASRFDLGGTNCTVDAACASSLAAFRMAAQELRLGTADLVLTGGIDATNDPLMFTNFSKTPALSRTGECRPFSDDADGTMLGEGVGMFAMRRLEDAERDGDRIYAVIRGLGASSDGRAKSIYAPRAAGQMQALRRAYDEAGYTPAEVELVEAHGTGTAAGDAAEVEALKTVFAEAGGAARGWCALGSVKSQIGHTKAAAGAASVYKVVMALHHKVLPPTIKISQPNPSLGLEDSAFCLSGVARPWVREGSRPRRAGISSFGFGGSNYHMTIEEYRGAVRPARVRALASELVLASGADAATAMASARTALRAAELPGGFAVAARASQLAFEPGATVRLAFVVADAAELAVQLRDIEPHVVAGRPTRLPKAQAAVGPARPGRVGLLFPGQGSQYPGMGADLAMAFEAARTVWDEAAGDCVGLAAKVFPAGGFGEAGKARQVAELTATDVAQPAIGVTSAMLLALLRATGVRAEAAAGHSYGELTALYAAGALDGAGLRAASMARGALMAEAARSTEGAMLAVFRPLADVQALLGQLGLAEVAVANHNGPEQVVVAGAVGQIEAFAAQLAARAMEHRRLPVATAFHSPIVAPACAPFRAALDDVAMSAPSMPVYGCATGMPFAPQPAAIRDALAGQIATPVRFVDQVMAMADAGIDTFIEVGPGTTLSELVGRILVGRGHSALPMDRRGRNGVTQFWELCGTLALAGHRLDLGFAWEGYAVTAPVPEKRTAATLMIDGALYAKPYPPVGGRAVLPGPNPEVAQTPPVATSAPAPAGGMADAIRSIAEAHIASQNAMAAAHTAFLRQTEALLAGGAVPGREPEAPPAPLHAPLPAMIATPAPQVVVAPGPNLAGLLLGIVAEKTGYPVEMLDPEMELEADLGIDSIKRVEILAALRAAAPELPELEARDLGGLRTLSAILARLGSVAPVAVASVPAPLAAPAPAPAPAPVPTRDLAGLLLGIVAEKTGYPVEMLDPEMELEADLGIDSIKRVEILAALRAAAPELPELEARDLGGLRTLSAILERLGSVSRVAAAPVPTPVAAPQRDLAALLLGIVAEKTGYPVEMLDPEMELEADLGIDSIKRVEILAALRAAAPELPELETRDLGGLRTLSAILQRLGSVALVAAPIAPPPLAPAVVQAPTRDLAGLLLGIVAEKTGYPVEMLDPEMELEADLGIDSIKRVEILAALRAEAPELPELEARDLGGLRTLSAILGRLEGVGAMAVGLPALPRIGLRAVSAMPAIANTMLPSGATVALIGDGDGVAACLAAALEADGYSVLPDEGVAEADVVIALAGLERRAGEAAALETHLQVFAAARAFAPRAGLPGAVFVTVQDTGGDFAVSGRAEASAWFGGLAGIAKTAAAEWPSARVAAIDLERGGQAPERLAARLLAALREGGLGAETGLPADGGRLVLSEVALGETGGVATGLRPGAVLVVSGGARGVVASCLKALAPVLRPRLLLLGRTALDDDSAGLPEAAAELSRALFEKARAEGRDLAPRVLAQEVAAVQAGRECRGTIAALQALGAEVMYRRVDVGDAGSVAAAVAEARTAWGAIDGVVHGAGELADRLIGEQTDAQFTRVFRTKVDGLRALLAATQADELRLLCLFSSVAGRYGNRGQVAYAAANEVLNKVAQSEATRRGAACRVVSLNWGPWDGGMVTEALRAAFASRGVKLIGIEDGARAFVAEAMGTVGEAAVEVVIGGRLTAPAETMLAAAK